MLLHLPSHQGHLAAFGSVFATTLNVIDHQGGQKGDVGKHPAPAQRAGGVGPLVADGAQEMAPGAHEDRAGGWHLQADRAPHTLFQLLYQVVERLALLLQGQLLLHESLIFFFPVNLPRAILTQGARFVVVVGRDGHGFSYNRQLKPFIPLKQILLIFISSPN